MQVELFADRLILVLSLAEFTPLPLALFRVSLYFDVHKSFPNNIKTPKNMGVPMIGALRRGG